MYQSGGMDAARRRSYPGLADSMLPAHLTRTQLPVRASAALGPLSSNVGVVVCRLLLQHELELMRAERMEATAEAA